MARTYDLMLDFGDAGIITSKDPDDAPELVSVSSYAILAVWRYRHPVTFSRAKGESFSKNPADATRLREQVLLVVEDIQAVSVTHTKNNHVSQLQATLRPGTNYLSEMFPGDWCAAWMVNSTARAQDLLKRIRDGKPCNEFRDGLKFFGRVAGIRKRIDQQPDGIRTSTYTMNAAGFQEFDAQLYYEPYLASTSVGAATEWLQKTGIDINNLIAGSGQGIDINKVLPLFLDAFYGKGVPKNSGFQETSSSLNQTQGLNNPNAFIVPDEVAAVLGVTRGTKPSGAKSWNDVCNVIWGIQKYQLSADGGTDPAASDQKAGSVFSPDGIPTGAGERRLKCPEDMLGTFLPSPPQFNGARTVWSILQQYLNPTVNEMFACLRVGPTGNVMPTLVVRQLPFTTGLLDATYRPKEVIAATESKAKKKPKAQEQQPNQGGQTRQLVLTRYGEVPRWQLPPILVKNMDLGRSDALRFNFIHVYGETGLQSQNKTSYIVRDPPVTDDLDIIRQGLRPYMATVNCAPTDANNRKAGDWMYILSDILMGQHLTLTGTIETVGLQSPVAPGDNLEFDNHVLHIEAVHHSFTAAPDGRKTFRTSLTLSHGLKADQLVGSDFGLFTGTNPQDLKTYDPGISTDYRVNKEAPQSPPQQGQATAATPNQQNQGVDADALGDKLQDILAKRGIN